MTGAVRWFPLLLVLAACTTTDRLVILHFNDFHGQIRPRSVVVRPGVSRPVGGFPAVAAYVREQRAAAAPDTAVWVTDGGDWFQGTPEGNEDRGWAVMACRNRLGLTAATIGNHDYDFGEANLIRLIRRAEHPVLGANIRTSAGTLPAYARPFHLQTVGGLRIAIVGLIASDTRNVSTGPFGDAHFGDEVATLQALLPTLRPAVDGLVLLTHCGIEKDRELARRFPAVDLILGGHSHTALPVGQRVGETWIVQSAGHGGAVSRVEVDLDRAARKVRVRSARLVELRANTVAHHAPTAAFLRSTFAHVGAKWDRPLGRVTGARDHRVLGAPVSTPVGNYVADLIRRTGAAEVGLMNKGGLRAVWRPGPLTRRQVFRMLPFDNTVVTVELTGVQLRTVLAQGLAPGRQPLEVAGANYAFRLENGERRLVDVQVGGRDLVPERNYRVATNSFLARGGDGCHELAQVRGSTASPLWLRDLVLRDMARHGNVIDLIDDTRIRLVE
jgi:2',3'-cyclic-nucleotide 2'-phosphodiesterase (5'-nucleotidase family)